MGIFIDLNQPRPGEKPQPPKNKQHASTILPVLCMKLAKATELFYHTMPDHEMRDCLPKYAKTWGYLYRFFSRKIHEHVSAVSRATLDRGFQLTCTIVARAMQNGGFYEMMNQSNEVQRALVINGIFKPRHMWYLFQDQFKAVSFPFIFHNGVRTDPDEERLRIDFRRLLRCTTMMMIYDFLRFCISAERERRRRRSRVLELGRRLLRLITLMSRIMDMRGAL